MLVLLYPTLTRNRDAQSTATGRDPSEPKSSVVTVNDLQVSLEIQTSLHSFPRHHTLISDKCTLLWTHRERQMHALLAPTRSKEVAAQNVGDQFLTLKPISVSADSNYLQSFCNIILITIAIITGVENVTAAVEECIAEMILNLR